MTLSTVSFVIMPKAKLPTNIFERKVEKAIPRELVEFRKFLTANAPFVAAAEYLFNG